jgi:hypothetical protein
MEMKHFSLSTSETNILVKIISILFGVVCITVAIFWLNFNIQSSKTDGTLYITIIFLSGFGFYQIWSGLGRTARYVEIGSDNIRIKKNPILPPVSMSGSEIERIELYPLNVIFFLKSKKRFLLRFGTTYHETCNMVKDEILNFAETNNISLEIVEEKL